MVPTAPAAGTARARQADRRRIQLIDAALRLFAERGFRGTTIADIAAATGTAHGLVYHYFRSKDELLEAVLERHAFLDRLDTILTVSSRRPAAKVLTEIAVGLSRLLDERPELLRLVVAESPTNPIVQQAMARVSEEGTRILGDYLRARVAAGELRPHDPAVPARALFWSIIAKHLGPGGADGFESDFVAVLLDGLRAR
ncbi:MAG TPA: TetR/AcrR family transcriptional regulator [Candidatus Limnocylindrales bacterium]|nr:TetR/AcrR family transcriptional regulator [Candidatus Limnocylindrales bacterium]